MTRDEAQTILLLYRPGTADSGDPQIAEALTLARREPDLARWLEQHCARQTALREQFRRIAVPAGLKEQIVSEEAARQRSAFRRPRVLLLAAAAAAVLLVLATLWFAPRPSDDTFAVYRSRMAGMALRGYAMDLMTNDPAQIRAYLARHGAPADYVVPEPLRKAVLTGCAIERWQGASVSMICFRSGKALPPGEPNDLWLFVAERAAVKGAPASPLPRFAQINRLSTVAWTEGGKLYLLGTTQDRQALEQWL